MIIHPLTPTLQNGELCVAARIEFFKPRPTLPDMLWFKFPEAEAHLVSERADAFAIALLFLALELGEDIQLRGTLSPQLAAGMREYQQLQCELSPRAYSPIEINADTYLPTPPARGLNASALSGGVDSTYTLWSHIAQNEPDPATAVSFAMFVHGLDIGLHDTESYGKCKEGFRRAYGGWNIQLLTPQTNVRGFSSGDNWWWENEVALAGLGQLYGKGLARLYIATSSYTALKKNGAANPLMDELLSTESTQIVGDGADKTKYGRVQTIARVPATHGALRVCNINHDGLVNCCQCDKCLSTMTALELCGVLPDYTTFPLPLDRNRIRFGRASYLLINNHKSFLKGALAQGRYDLAFDIAFKLFWNYFRWGGIAVKRRIVSVTRTAAR